MSRAEFSNTTRTECLQKQKYTCEICGHTLTDSIDRSLINFHHKHPCAQGGTNDIRNCVALCPNCHSGIHAMERRNGKHLPYHVLKKLWMETDEFYNYTGYIIPFENKKEELAKYSYSTKLINKPKYSKSILKNIILLFPMYIGMKICKINHQKLKLHEKVKLWFVGIMVLTLIIILLIYLLIILFNTFLK